MSDEPPLLEARGLKKYFSQQTNFIDTLMRREPDDVQAVDDVSFTLRENESQGVIGESGCGKTTLLRVLMGLYTPTDGDVYYKGQPFSEFDRDDWKEFRSNVQIIFQDPFNSLDPKMKVEETLREPMEVHDMDDQEGRMKRALEDAELSPAEQYLDRFPGQLSGGERQRVSIARALATDPDLILADEPVSMLDVSTQAAVLELLAELIDDYGVSMMYISHDLSTVSYICQKINVMYLGRFVESAPTEELLDDPKHPYAQALLGAVPIPDPHHGRPRTELEGDVIEPVGLGEGCRFRDRCPDRMDICEETPRSVVPDDIDIEDAEEWNVACHLYYDHESTADEASGSAEPTPTDD